MSSDIVKRLRDGAEYWKTIQASFEMTRAADRIEALEGEVERLKTEAKTATTLLEAEKWARAHVKSIIVSDLEAERDRLKAALRVTQERQNSDTMLLRQCYVTLAFAFYRLHESARSRDGELCLDFQRVRALIEKRFREIGIKL